jgi:hypothetical protein
MVPDLIFLIYLYQRWKYPVDKKHVNEFGFGGETLEGSGFNRCSASNDSGDGHARDRKTRRQYDLQNFLVP